MQLFNLNLIVSLLMASTTLALPVHNQAIDQPETHGVNETSTHTAHLVKRAMPDWANMPNNAAFHPAAVVCHPFPAGRAAFSFQCTCTRQPTNAHPGVSTVSFISTATGSPPRDTAATVQTRASEAACNKVYNYIRVL